ncbi:hypothetical protein JW968_03605 [Candidatus Woesearchaeota archaeon]|nr:hypothetical protein [Candidatus Woesearchaeota archaeon]
MNYAEYVGLQMDTPHRFFFPYYDTSTRTILTPHTTESIYELAQHSVEFLRDFLGALRKGYKLMRFDSKDLETHTLDESFNIFKQALMARIRSQRGKGEYHNPTSPECELFYSSLTDLLGHGERFGKLEREYERASGYPINPDLIVKHLMD